MRAEAATPEAYARAYDTLQFLMGMVEAEAFAALRPRRDAGRLPVAIVAGFLGAGKTTLMRRLLTGDHGRRITALVNDVASVNIDAALIARVSDETIALANGCVCCSQAGGAARALVELGGRERPPDLVLIEASGVADPWSLSQTAASIPGVVLDCVTTVVDAGEPQPDPSLEYLLHRQVSAADLVLLNKIDLVSRQAADRAAATIARLAPRAEILRTVDCAIPYGLVFDAHRAAPRAVPGSAGVSDDRFVTLALEARSPVEQRALEERLAGLPAGILRAKGLLRLTHDPGRLHLLQMVGRRWRWEASDERGDGVGRLALIALAGAIDTRELRRRFAPLGFRAKPSDH